MSINKSSLIIEAVENCNIEDLQSLLDNGKKDIDVGNAFMQTPLHLAVWGRFEQGVTLLLERGAKINVRDQCQQTPLHLSCSSKNKNMISVLLEKGAEINCIDMEGMSPLHVAVIKNFKEGVELLLTRGADLNTQDDTGDTPLHSAIRNEYLQIVNLLLINGAKLNLKNDHSETALHTAARTSQKSFVRSLLLYGAEVDVQDFIGRTPLHLSLKYQTCDDNDVVEDLLDCGASLIIGDEEGYTPLSLAIKESIFLDGFITYLIKLDGFIKHFIKLQCVDLQLAYKTSYMYSPKSLEGYNILCANELAKLKTTRFCNQSVFDVLSKYKDPTFLSNTKMREAIYSDFETEFPLYTMLLRAMFRHAERRVPLLDTAQGVLIHLIGVHLPPEISRKIISNLSNEDIVNLIAAGNCN